MKRFSLITRLGKTDAAKVNVLQRDSSVHELDFLDGDNRRKHPAWTAVMRP